MVKNIGQTTVSIGYGAQLASYSVLYGDPVLHQQLLVAGSGLLALGYALLVVAAVVAWRKQPPKR